MITFIAIAGAAIIGYLLGSARGFAQAIRLMADMGAAEESDPWVDAQRESAPWQ